MLLFQHSALHKFHVLGGQYTGDQITNDRGCKQALWKA